MVSPPQLSSVQFGSVQPGAYCSVAVMYAEGPRQACVPCIRLPAGSGTQRRVKHITSWYAAVACTDTDNTLYYCQPARRRVVFKRPCSLTPQKSNMYYQSNFTYLFNEVFYCFCYCYFLFWLNSPASIEGVMLSRDRKYALDPQP